MRILQIAYKSDIAGGEIVLLNLCDYFHALGHEVQVVCPRPGDLATRVAELGLKVHFLPIPKTYDLLAAYRLRRLIQREKIDLVHSHGMLVNIISRLAGQGLPGVKLVNTVHLTRDLKDQARYTRRVQRLKNHYYRRLDNWTAGRADRIIAVSYAVQSDLIRQGIPEAKISVIQNGIQMVPQPEAKAVERLRQEFNLNPTDFVLGSVVRLSRQKDIPTLLNAMKILVSAYPRLKLLLIGSGLLTESMKQLTSQMGLDPYVIFTGFRTDVRQLYYVMDIFVLSSLWEGLPLVILEAMSSGRPIVATAVDGTMEAVVDGSTGYLVPTRQPAALAESISRLIDHPDRRHEFAAAGQARIRDHFSIERMGCETQRLYQNLFD